MRTLLVALIAFACAGVARAEPLLGADAWRADIAEMAAAIKRVHPNPFETLDEAAFDAAVASLLKETPALSDDEVMVRMAAIAALLRDGHTRLSVHSEHPSLGIVQGHTGTADPAHAGLKFNSLPVEFYLFDDGLYVTGAEAAHTDLIGAKVTHFGETPTEAAIAAATPAISADNEYGSKRLIPDRLRSPEFLVALGVIDTPRSARLTLVGADGEEHTIDLAALPPGEANIVRPESKGADRLRRIEPDKAKLRAMHQGAMYVRITEIENKAPEYLALFMRETMAQAKKARASRLIIDIRDNQGGSADWNPAIIRALAGSDYDRYGKLFVLIGRGTFSAAQMLAISLEQTVDAIFVGEPTSSTPCHYGDSRKTVLQNSGLTLRVSTRHWCLAFGDGTRPHLDAPVLAADFFAGRDRAIETALAFKPAPTVAAQIEDLVVAGKIGRDVSRMKLALTSPQGELDIADDLIRRAERLQREGNAEAALRMLKLASGFYPENAEARAALAAAEKRGG